MFSASVRAARSVRLCLAGREEQGAASHNITSSAGQHETRKPIGKGLAGPRLLAHEGPPSAAWFGLAKELVNYQRASWPSCRGFVGTEAWR